MAIGKELLEKFPLKRHFHPGNEFFDDGNQAFKMCGESVDEDIDFIIDSIGAVHIEEFCCTVKGCMKRFTSPLQFNRHYDMLHRYCCQVCARNFPSNHLLSIHITENHDMYFEAEKDRGVASFVCLVEECKEKFTSEGMRKNHLVTSHKYPADFRFNATKRVHKKYKQKDVKNLRNKSEKTNGKLDSPHEILKKVNKHDIRNVHNTKTKTVEQCTSMEVEDAVNKNTESKQQECAQNKTPIEIMNTQEHNSDTSVQSSATVEKKRCVPKSVSFGRGVQRGFAKNQRRK